MVEEYFHIGLSGLPRNQQEEMHKNLESMLAENGVRIVEQFGLIPVISVVADSKEKEEYVRGLENLGYTVEQYQSDSLHI